MKENDKISKGVSLTKKKICYVLPCYDIADHTHFAHLHDFIKEIAGLADISLLVEGTGGPTNKSLLRSELGVDKIYIQQFHLLPLRYLENLAAIFAARMSGDRDFYVHYSFLSAFNASLVIKIFGGRVFYWNCGLPWKYQKSFFREFFERIVYKIISYLVTGTEFLAREYARRYGIGRWKIKVMPNWISSERFSPEAGKIEALKAKLKIASGDKILLFVHRLSQRKGAYRLPPIFKKIKVSNVKLIIIGEGPQKEFLKKELKDEIAGGRVQMLGWLPNRELPDYFALADVFLMPSEEEGFPRVILEAMAVGLPFVASNIGGVSEIIPDEFRPNLVAAGKIDDYAQKINLVLKMTKQERENWKKTAAEWVGQFELKKVAQLFYQMIN